MNWQRLQNKRIRMIGAAMLIVGLLAWGGIFLAQVIKIGDTAERQTMSMNYVYVTSLEYVQAYHQWPRSWDDLARMRPAVGFVAIPRDQEWVEQHVWFDFTARLEDIAAQKPSTFTGYGPRGRAFYDYSHGYAAVIEAAGQSNTTTRPVATTSRGL